MNTLKSLFLLAFLSAILVWVGGMIGGKNGALVALVLAGVMNFVSYWWSDKIVLKMYKASEVGRDNAPDLYSDVEELAQIAGLPMPRVYIIPEQAPNAFATGRDPHHSAVAVTQGIMRLLNRNELKGVIAHELAHIRNRDILIGSVAATIAGAISYLAYMAQFAAIFGGGGGGDRRGGGMLGLLAMAIIAPMAAMIVRMAISRTREFGADKTGAEICGNPLYLADALRKLQAGASRVPLQVSEQAAESTAHMMIVSPMIGGGFAKLFSTHPPTEERVARLEAMVGGASL
ncbi:MAG: zinc metalloprotease HtpX [Candidatus Dadabacteria bacterium]|nr:zinc metalloprotease HtpX [Candidatus Dadabacteria bacterium]MDE0519298.1 zinc metalloprotease HtpX [Candidatus Dadabacteria bacterium]MDE0662878.1 zinc metalloprotease HtpX [Candidatus Dadabacteria bacterium]